jgi:predicted aldo/keto reductase-like oxidoreductase
MSICKTHFYGGRAVEKVRFGKTGLMVSRVAFGGIPIERLNIADAIEVVRSAIGSGINFIDTANSYTDSEEKIGKAIKGIPRDKLIIASKSGARDKKTFLENVDLALRRLGTDYIDIYQHHNISKPEDYDAIMGDEGAYLGMMESVRAGKIRFPAFSSHDCKTAAGIMRDGHFYAVQLPFNYVDDEAAAEAVPLAKELDMGFIAMKPFGGGMLSNAKLSMKYLLQFDNIVPDPGIEKLSELEEIIQIVEAGEKLSDIDIAEIEKIKSELGSSWCHRCDYCQPCPQKIRIGEVLTVEKLMKRIAFVRAIAFAEQHVEAARSCTGCRECAGRCPYNLDIPALLKDKIAKWDRFVAENR